MSALHACVAAFLLIGAQVHASQAWPEMKWPQGIRPEIITEDMRFNGRPVRIYQFVSAEPLTTLKERFRAMLGSSAKERILGQRYVIGAPLAHTFITVDMQSAGNTVQGRVMQTDIDTYVKPAPPMPVDSRLWSHTESVDGSKKGADVFVLENRHSVATNNEFYRTQFNAKGMKLIGQNEELPGGRPGYVARYAGPEGSAAVVIEDQGEFRVIVVNEVRESK